MFLEENRRRIIEWLKGKEVDATLDTRIELQAHLKHHHLGTCAWLYDDMTFKAWDNATRNASIWYHASAGTGKTILASALIRHLQNRGSKTIYFFYSFNDSARSKWFHAIQCLVLQLAAQCNVIPERVNRLFEADSSNMIFRLGSVETAVKVFQAFLDCSSRTHVILDGLDECSDHVVMKDYLTQLIPSKTCGLVKWFFTSRHQHNIRLLAQEVGASDIAPSILTINGDIKRFLEQRVKKADQPSTCIDCWTEESEGNFLWITLMHDTLTGDSVTCNEELRAELKKFPKGLTGCYLRGLRQLSSRPDSHQDLAR